MATRITSPGPLGHLPRRPVPPPGLEPEALAEAYRAAGPRNRRLAMRLAIVAEALFFAGLIAAVWQIRRDATVWPPAGVMLPDRTLLLANTAVLLASAVTVWLGLRSFERGRARAGLAWTGTTTALGVGFLYGQWREFVHMGGWQAGEDLFSPLFNILSGFHAAHVFAGLVLLLVTLAFGFGGRIRTDDHLVARLSAWFWWLVAAVWLVLLLSLLSF